MKVPYKVELGTYINHERGFYPENNEPFEEVERPLARLVSNGLVIEETKGTWGTTKIADYEIKSLENTGENLLDSESIKNQRKGQKKLIDKLKKDFNKLFKAYDDESIAREKFALDRLNKLKSKTLKEWKTFEWKNNHKVDEIIRILEKK